MFLSVTDWAEFARSVPVRPAWEKFTHATKSSIRKPTLWGIREMLVNQAAPSSERSANPSGIVGSKTNVSPGPLVKKRKTSVTQVQEGSPTLCPKSHALLNNGEC